MEREALKRTTVFLTDEQRTHLQRMSKRSGMPVAEVVRRALDFYLGTEDKFRRLGLPMGDLDGLLDAVREEERKRLPSDPSNSVDQKLMLILARLDKIASGEANAK